MIQPAFQGCIQIHSMFRKTLVCHWFVEFLFPMVILPHKGELGLTLELEGKFWFVWGLEGRRGSPLLLSQRGSGLLLWEVQAFPREGSLKYLLTETFQAFLHCAAKLPQQQLMLLRLQQPGLGKYVLLRGWHTTLISKSAVWSSTVSCEFTAAREDGCDFRALLLWTDLPGADEGLAAGYQRRHFLQRFPELCAQAGNFSVALTPPVAALSSCVCIYCKGQKLTPSQCQQACKSST